MTTLPADRVEEATAMSQSSSDPASKNAQMDLLQLSGVLLEEYRELRQAWKFDGVEAASDEEGRLKALFEVAHKSADEKPLAALCLSGGGIRSATFNLGVIQALAERGLLERFDYLSSVSGGGYIASWLSGWIHRAGGLGKINADLKGLRQDRNPSSPEPRAIQHLREYSNYLTPRLGLLSVDTWTSALIILRNCFLNWLVLVPILSAILALPLLPIAQWDFATWSAPFRGRFFFFSGLALGGVGLVFMNALRGVRRLETTGDTNGGAPASGDWTQRFVFLGLVPLLAGTSCVVMALGWGDIEPFSTFRAALWPSALLGLALPVIAFLVSIPVQRALGAAPAAVVWDLFALLGAGAAETAAYAWILSHWVGPVRDWPHCGFLVVLPVLVLAPMLLGKSLFVAFASAAEGKARESQFGDAQREWWARWSAWISIALVAWMAASAVVYLTPWLFSIARNRVASALSITGIGTTLLGGAISLLGKSAKTPAPNGKSEHPWTQLGIKLGVPIFCALVAMLLSLGTQALILAVAGGHGLPEEPVSAPWYVVICTVLGLGIFGLLIGWFVNVNRFSLQAFYRNRLVRCYLGASNVPHGDANGKQHLGRMPNFFTGFDPNDNIRLHRLRANRPLPVVNMTLNLVGGANLAWQERKAESFTASPLHCGNAELGYRRAEAYGGAEGMSLGTAVSISGAAANPNMGYNSSPAVALVMALFNARLGAWLGNPGRPGDKVFRNSGPGTTSPYWMLAEAFGRTDDRQSYVNLSDGGHFDNLGLYEMVRRRCRFILVSDAGQDLECHFADLGNAIRKIRIDLGISIEFPMDGIHIYPRVPGDPNPRAGYCAIGGIDYGKVDEGAPPGILVYLKPAICGGGEPYDVYSYSRASTEFPHEPTSDQWFRESQFEAYRMLGKTAMLAITAKLTSDSLDHVLDAIRHYLAHTGSSAPEGPGAVTV
jgi:hypothetical protein